MMEFTLSRVVLAVCGILLLGAVVVPLTASEDSTVSNLYQEEVDLIAETVSTFYESSQDVSIIDMGDLLPTDECSLKFDGREITLSDGTHEYKAYCEYTVESVKEYYDSNDYMYLLKDEGKVVVLSFR